MRMRRPVPQEHAQPGKPLFPRNTWRQFLVGGEFTDVLGIVVLDREARTAGLTDLGRYAIRRVRGMAQPGDPVLQVRITLADVDDPPVWRRVLIPGSPARPSRASAPAIGSTMPFSASAARAAATSSVCAKIDALLGQLQEVTGGGPPGPISGV